MSVELRGLTAADAAAAAAIYNHAVLNTDATLDTEQRTEEAAKDWIIEHSAERYPVLGAFVDGRLAGYGTLSPFARRAGYLASAEISLYVAPEHHNRGIGTALCAQLTKHAERVGMSTVLALITATNEASQRLFVKAGYQLNGSMQAIGHKLGHLVDLNIMQKLFPENFSRYDGSSCIGENLDQQSF
jgi:L-amino acid N-acyltransferase YncA